MTTDWDDDIDEIVVDDQPREDGLVSEDESFADHELTSAPAPQWSAIGSAIPKILERLDAMLGQHSDEDNDTEDEIVEALNHLMDRLDTLTERLSGLEARLDECLPESRSDGTVGESDRDRSATLQAVVAEDAELLSDPTNLPQEIERLVFGENLCGQSELLDRRQEILSEVFAGDGVAIGLAARLMLVRTASAEELAPLLKEVGEAFYRRFPKTTDEIDPLELSLAKDLDRRIADVGLSNSIELVRPDDRYDATRHVSSDRGVAVESVRGWVVLRGNGKPLTKASVGLR